MKKNNYLKSSERWDEMTYNGLFKRDLWKNHLPQKILLLML